MAALCTSVPIRWILTARSARVDRPAAAGAAGLMAVAVDDGSDLLYLLSDHLGSVVAVVDDNGDLVLGSEQRYLPFGGLRIDPGITQTDFAFTGQRNLAAVGLMDYNARWYGQNVYRFIQPDAMVTNPTRPQLLNRYSYVLNNPINWSDPTGHCVFAFGVDTLVCVTLVEFVVAGSALALSTAIMIEPKEQRESQAEAAADAAEALWHAAAEAAKDAYDTLKGALESRSSRRGTAANLASHLAMALRVDAVAGFSGHPGGKDPDDRDQNKLAREIRNFLKDVKKSGKNISDYLAEQKQWSERMVKDTVDALDVYVNEALPELVDKGLVSEAVQQQIIELAEALGVSVVP